MEPDAAPFRDFKLTLQGRSTPPRKRQRSGSTTPNPSPPGPVQWVVDDPNNLGLTWADGIGPPGYRTFITSSPPHDPPHELPSEMMRRNIEGPELMLARHAPVLDRHQSQASNSDWVRHRITFEGEARGWTKQEALLVVGMVEAEVHNSPVDAGPYEMDKAADVAAVVAFMHIRACLDRVPRNV